MLGLQEHLSLDSNEHVVAAVRSHTFRSIAKAIPCVVILFLLFLYMFPLFYIGLWGVALFFIALITDAIFLCRILIQWYGSVYLLTEQRLFCIDRRGFFKKRVNEIILENINELSYDTKGILPMIFSYGDIQCSLFTTRGSFTIIAVRHPQEFLSLISKYVSQTKRQNQFASSTMDPHAFEKKMLPIDSGSKLIEK